MIKDLRFLWSQVPPKGKRIVHIVWPSWVAAGIILITTPLYVITEKWWTIGFDAVAFGFMVMAYWRIRPLLTETMEKLGALKDLPDGNDGHATPAAD